MPSRLAGGSNSTRLVRPPNKTPLQSGGGVIFHGSIVRPLSRLPRRSAATTDDSEYFPRGESGEHHRIDEFKYHPALTPELPRPARTQPPLRERSPRSESNRHSRFPWVLSNALRPAVGGKLVPPEPTRRMPGGAEVGGGANHCHHGGEKWLAGTPTKISPSPALHRLLGGTLNSVFLSPLAEAETRRGDAVRHRST